MTHEEQEKFRDRMEKEIGVHQLGERLEFFDREGETIAKCECGRRTAIRAIVECTSPLDVLNTLVAEGYEIEIIDADRWYGK